jgi:glutaconate CoA-transferase subunit B
VTDLGTFEKDAGGEFVLTAIAPGATVDEIRELCGFELRLARGDLPELDAPTSGEVEALRRWDPRGWFLRA